MRTGALRKLGSPERDWQSLALLAERRRSSVTLTTLAVFNARSLGGCASSRTRKWLAFNLKWGLLTIYDTVLEAAKDHQIPLLQIQKISFHDQCHQELILNHSKLSSMRTANLFLLDRLCADQHQTRRLIPRNAIELATLTSLQLHQRLPHDSLFRNQPLLLMPGSKLWSPAPSTTACYEIGR